MTYLSVCSGIEAASVAWKDMTNWEPVGFSEIEPFPSSVLAYRFPGVPNLGDMTKYKEWNIGRSIDLLVGGTPCQSFSVAGLRQGLTDPRGNLMLTFGAIAGHFKPTWIVWENVPGVLSSNGGRDFGSFLGMLGELGYGFAYRVLDAQYFGVAQRRRRVFVVGYLGDWRRAASVLFESESLFGDSPPSRETGKEVALPLGTRVDRGGSHREAEGNNLVAGTLSSRTTGGGGLGTDFDLAGGLQVHDGRGRGAGDLVPTLCSDHAGRPSDFSPLVSMALNAKGGSGRMDGESETLVPLLARSLAARNDGSPCVDRGPDVVIGTTMSNGDAHSGYKDEHGLVAQSGVRRLTPLECERLQGFPDGWTRIPVRFYKTRRITKLRPVDQWDKVEGGWALMAADGPRYKALGNSMAVPCMRWIGERIVIVNGMVWE